MTYNKETLKEAIVQKLRLNYGCTEQQATDGEMMKACAMVLRDIMAEHGVQTREETAHEEKRKVHYLSLEFLMGRSLMKNAFNLALLEPLTAAIGELGFKAADIFDMEPDAGLGNGGLGRLAACYLDSMTTLEIPAAGYSICYELGIFKQKIVEGQQVELPDDWMQLGDAWLLPKLQVSPSTPRICSVTTGYGIEFSMQEVSSRSVPIRICRKCFIMLCWLSCSIDER